MNTIKFHPQFYPGIESGTKTQTRRMLDWKLTGFDPCHQSLSPLRYMETYSAENPIGEVGDLLAVDGRPDLRIQISRIYTHQLHLIAPDDILAEGFPDGGSDPYRWFRETWESFYPGTWDSNPRILAVHFKRVHFHRDTSPDLGPGIYLTRSGDLRKISAIEPGEFGYDLGRRLIDHRGRMYFSNGRFNSGEPSEFDLVERAQP